MGRPRWREAREACYVSIMNGVRPVPRPKTVRTCNEMKLKQNSFKTVLKHF